jgi:excisionase family DNA binding protein
MSDHLLHSRATAAHCLGISIRKIDSLIAAKKIRVVKIGRRTMISDAELKRFAKRGA